MLTHPTVPAISDLYLLWQPHLTLHVLSHSILRPYWPLESKQVIMLSITGPLHIISLIHTIFISPFQLVNSYHLLDFSLNSIHETLPWPPYQVRIPIKHFHSTFISPSQHFGSFCFPSPSTRQYGIHLLKNQMNNVLKVMVPYSELKANTDDRVSWLREWDQLYGNRTNLVDFLM